MCNYHEDFPHTDRDGDCVDDGLWVCQFGWNRCIIDVCEVDTDCGPQGWRCSEFAICYYECSTDSDCPGGWACRPADDIGGPGFPACGIAV